MSIKTQVGALALAALCVLTAISVDAAELLDVKPNVVGNSVSVEVTADIPMTYTYYKISGEPRAVVDIADADPEKIEPLLVVNKGAVSSISVDKAMIGNISVSRLVFNLVSETEINVIAAQDRKKMTISFGKPTEPMPAIVASASETALHRPEVKVEAPIQKIPAKVEKEEDPLGLDEPQVSSTTPVALPSVVEAAAVSVSTSNVKLAPVVPNVPLTSTATTKVSDSAIITGIVVGNKTVDIQAKSEINKYKSMILDNPPRLVIDIVGTKSVAASSFSVKKFGVEKVRMATNGGLVRVVLDSSSIKLPAYKIVKTDKGLQVHFK